MRTLAVSVRVRLLAIVITCATSAVVAAAAPGLLVRIYELDGGVAAVPELAPGQLPNVFKVVQTLDLDTQRAGDFGPVSEDILTIAEGTLTPPAAGRYTLRLTSDDGSLLWLNGRLVINNDGLHGATPKDAEVELLAGAQPLKVAHHQGGGDGVLRLEWKPADAPGDAFVVVPATALGHEALGLSQIAPGKKRHIPPLRKGRPGDGTPVVAPHPGLVESGAAPAGAGGAELLPGGFVRVRGVTAWVPEAGAYCVPLAADQVLVGSDSELKRVFIDTCGDLRQGCVLRCGALPRGSVKEGPGSVFEMRAVRVQENGLEVEFTRPLDARVGWEPEAYYVEQWPFDVAAQRAPQRDAVVYPVQSASVAADRTRVFLEVAGLKPGNVVYLRLLPPCLSEKGDLPWATEAWYTLTALPQGRAGKVLPPPPAEPQNVLTAAEQAEGWQLLFDGRTSAGWRGWKKAEFPDGWQIRDGCLTRVGPGGDICTAAEFDNFELKIDWRIAPAGNSGIFFRASEEFDWCWRTAPEMQVLDNAEHADGRNPLTSAGSNYALHAPVRDATQPVGMWNEARIVVRGPHVEYWLNGVQTVTYELGSPAWEQLVAASKFKEMPQYGRTKTGHIVLQDHGDRVWFRNIKIRKL